MKQRIHRDQPATLAVAIAEIQRLRAYIETLEMNYNDNEVAWMNRHLVQRIEGMQVTQKISNRNWQRQLSTLVAKQHTSRP